MDRSAIVTGASAGIGFAVTATLASDGYAVTMVARNAARLETTAEKLRGDGYEVNPVALDVTGDGAADHLGADHLERHGGLDVVVAATGSSAGTAAGASPTSCTASTGSSTPRRTAPDLLRATL